MPTNLWYVLPCQPGLIGRTSEVIPYVVGVSGLLETENADDWKGSFKKTNGIELLLAIAGNPELQDSVFASPTIQALIKHLWKDMVRCFVPFYF